MYENAAKKELDTLVREIQATATDFYYDDVTETIQLVPAQ